MRIAFPTLLHRGLQPVIAHNLKFSLTSISKKNSYHLSLTRVNWLLRVSLRE